MERDVDVIISVDARDYSRAQKAAEQAYQLVDVPEKHFLRTSSDEELVDIVSHPTEWSPFDVAHAKKMIEQRDINAQAITLAREQAIGELQRGKAMSIWLFLATLLFTLISWSFILYLSVLMVIICSLGLLLSWSTITMKKYAGEKSYYAYNDRSRTVAVGLFILNCISILSGVALIMYSNAISNI